MLYTLVGNVVLFVLKAWLHWVESCTVWVTWYVTLFMIFTMFHVEWTVTSERNGFCIYIYRYISFLLFFPEIFIFQKFWHRVNYLCTCCHVVMQLSVVHMFHLNLSVPFLYCFLFISILLDTILLESIWKGTSTLYVLYLWICKSFFPFCVWICIKQLNNKFL